MLWTKYQKIHGTWQEFEATFYKQYIIDMVCNLKKYELVNLEYGSMSIVDYEQRFVSFVVDLHLLDSILAKIFEDKLSPCIRGCYLFRGLRSSEMW